MHGERYHPPPIHGEPPAPNTEGGFARSLCSPQGCFLGDRVKIGAAEQAEQTPYQKILNPKGFFQIFLA